MPTAPLLRTPDARRTANRLLDVLQREGIAAGAAVTESSVLAPRRLDAEAALNAPVPTVAHTLLRGICEGNPQAEVRQRPLIRWLELRDSHPGPAQLQTTPSRCDAAPVTPRSS